MGSGSSRSATSTQSVQNRKRSSRKNIQGVLVPFLRSFSCGASPSCNAEGVVEGIPRQVTDIVDYQNVPGMSIEANLCGEACVPCGICNSTEEKLGHVLCDGSSSGHTLTSPGMSIEANLCGEAFVPCGICNSTEEKLGHVLCDGRSSGHTLTSPLENSEHLCVSEILRIHSPSDDGCVNASSDTSVGLDGKSKNGQCELLKNESNSVMKSCIPSSEEIHRGIADASCSFDITSAQVDLVVPSICSNSMTPVESDMHEDHEVTVLNNLQSNLALHSATEDVLDMVRQPPPVEVGGSSLALEAVSGPSESDSHLQSEELVFNSHDASRSENVGVLHVEGSGLLTQSSGQSSSFAQGVGSGREARRNNRRRLLDALTRATSRRRTLFRTFVLASEDIDGSGSWNDSWGLFDWSSLADEAGFADEDDFFAGRSLEMEERRWRLRPQVLALQRLRSGIEGGSGHSRHCASGRHPDGDCFCEEVVMTEETNTRASISRIVMLAEALFELLDEIHHQSVALSRSTSSSLISLPAPAAVVESFPLRIYKKTEKTEDALEEAPQCYICLIEYEDGDRVRTLPCHHEYHVFCVDKWLKEVHRVCPLCRGNVCDASPGDSVSS